MALPSAYFLSTKRVKEIFEAIKGAQAPDQFTLRFLGDLGFASSADRPFVNVLKALGFLQDSGSPTSRYFEFLDGTRSGAVMAEAVREAYADLFQVNAQAHEMSAAEVKAKMKTLTKGQYSDKVIGQMAATLRALVDLADFTVAPEHAPRTEAQEEDQEAEATTSAPLFVKRGEPQLTGLVYNINLHLPESRDPSVYEALFRSLRIHLFE
jgi:hypothetical protein